MSSEGERLGCAHSSALTAGSPGTKATPAAGPDAHANDERSQVGRAETPASRAVFFERAGVTYRALRWETAPDAAPVPGLSDAPGACGPATSRRRPGGEACDAASGGGPASRPAREPWTGFPSSGGAGDVACGAGASATAPRDPIVLLHGFSQSAHAWDEVVPHLATACPGRALWAPEFVGHGCSDAPRDPAPYAFSELVATLAAFIDEVVLPDEARRAPSASGRVALVGYSMGGRVALAYAVSHPQRVASLVLESSGLGPANEEARTQAAERDAALAARVRREPLADFMDFWETRPVFSSQLGLPPKRRTLLRAARMRNDPEALALTFEGSGQHAMPDLSGAPAWLASRGVPVLYLAGKLDPKYAGVARQLSATDAWGLDVRVLPDAGHDVHFEQPIAFCEQVAPFLASAPLSGQRGSRSAPAER